MTSYRKLGRSGLRVSPICLGTMTFGGRTDEASALRIVEVARDAGLNFLDTADVYNAGRSEEIVGRAIRRDRNAWVVATKVCNAMGDGPNCRGLSRKWLIEACEASLRRLGTDHVDIYYLHKEDHGTPMGETVRALADLVRQGKVRYLGLSNFRSWRIAEICHLCDQAGIERPVVLQPYYNIMNRMPEVELLPACGYYGLGVAPYSPLARGVLTGKYPPDAPPVEGSRAAASDERMMQTRVATREPDHRADAQGACRAQGLHAGTARLRLAIEQCAGDQPGGGAADRGAAARLSGGARCGLHRRGRGAGG